MAKTKKTLTSGTPASSHGKRFLVTGGCGFIGSNFIRTIYETYPSDTIVNLDALTYAGNLENLADIEAAEAKKPAKERRYTLAKGDICDAAFVRSILASHTFDYIVHFAAETHVDRSYFNVSDFLRTNVEGTRVLLEAARQQQPQARFVHVSTDEIYGSIEKEYADEDAHIRPTNLYAASKAAADIIVQSYIKTYRVPAIIVRGSNNYGPYQYPEKLIPLTISNLLGGIHIPLHGSGEHVRSWIHVRDFCEALDTVVRRAPLGSTYNISGEEHTNLEVLGIVADVIGVPLEAHLRKVSDRPGADMRYAPDSTKFRKEFGWRPSRSLKEAMPEIVEWYRSNNGWWERIKAKKEYLDHYEKQSKGLWY